MVYKRHYLNHRQNGSKVENAVIRRERMSKRHAQMLEEVEFINQSQQN